MKTKTPRKILLDQYHVDIYIRPNEKLSREDRRRLKALLNMYFDLLIQRLHKDLENKISVRISQ